MAVHPLAVLTLAPFPAAEALGASPLAVLESGFMVTAPGATAQHFHRDVAPAVVSCSSLTASLQVDSSRAPPVARIESRSSAACCGCAVA